MLDFLLGIAVGAGVTAAVGWSYGRHLLHTGQLSFYSDEDLEADFPLEMDAIEGVCECRNPHVETDSPTWCQKCGRRFADSPRP